VKKFKRLSELTKFAKSHERPVTINDFNSPQESESKVKVRDEQGTDLLSLIFAEMKLMNQVIQ